MKNSTPDQKESRPRLVASSRRVTHVNAGFTELTGYSREEVIDADIDAILSLLRLTGSRRTASWIFTKTLEPREVVVSRQSENPSSCGADEIYMFCEKPHSRLEEVLPYTCQLLEENMTGVAVYSAEDLTLLKANQTYLDFCDGPFLKPDKAVGETIGAFFGGYKGSPAEKAVNRSLTTGKSETVRELRFDRFGRGDAYCDQLITPVKAGGRIKYVVINMRDVTEQVTRRQQSGRIAAVFENIPFPLVVLDRDGKSTNANRAARELLSPPVSNELPGTQFYDADDNPIAPNDTPCHKVRWGERAADFLMAVKKGEETSFLNVSGTPVYDIDGKFIAGLISYRDVTEQARYAKHHKTLIDAMQSGVIQYDSEGRVITMNPAAAKILGMIPELAMGRPITEQLRAIKPDGTDLASEEYPSTIALRTGKPVRGTILGLLNAVTEEYRWINVNAVPLFNPNDSEPYQVFAVFDDITEQKKAEDQLKKSEAVLRSVLDNSGDFIYSLNTQTNTYEYVSPFAEKVLGCSIKTFIATDVKTFHESVHPDDRPVFEAALRALEDKNEAEIRFRQRVNDGEYRWFSNHLTDVRDENGRIIYRNGRIRDITEQVKSEEVIRYQAGLLQSVSDIIISSDENNVIKSWNKAAELTFGWTEEEALGQRIDTLLKTRIIGQTPEEAYNRLRQHGKVECEMIDTCKDGRKLNIACSSHAIKDANGKITGVVGIFRNVTEKKKMEDALREKETYLRLATEAAKLGTYAFDFKKGTVFLSDELKALWGVLPGKSAEFDDMAFFKGMHPDDKQLFRDKIIAANDPKSDGLIEYDYRVILPDGTVKWLHTRGQTAFGDMGGQRVPVYTAGVVIDITERVAAENSIREMSEDIRIIMESTEDYIYSVDRDRRLLFFNSAYSSDVLRLFGVKLEKGMRISDAIPPLDSAYWEGIFERVANEGKVYLEARIDSGTRVMQFSFNPVYIDGQLTEITVFGRDITERVNSEREIIRLNTTLEKRVQERTEELQKSLSDLKNLSRIISHDLKEPIRQIGYYAEHIQSLTEKGPIRTEAADIKKTCGRMTRLIDGLSEFAMSSELKIKKEAVNVKKMAAAVFSELKASAENKTRLQFESGLPVVCADSLLLRRVLYNLLSNAMKFSSKREVSEITIGCTEENGQYAFYIRDNGVGFDMQHAHKLYNAFERLHSEEEFEGSGMGLAAVRNIIERHGGRTWIESREDVGTTVYFTLPV